MGTGGRSALTGFFLALAAIPVSARPAEANGFQDITVLWITPTVILFALYALVSFIVRLARAWTPKARRLVRMAFALLGVFMWSLGKLRHVD